MSTELQDSEDWKRRYYRSLEDLEAKESEWAQIEMLLRDAMARFSLALTGLDAGLDRQLDSFRRYLRTDVTDERLTELTRSITETLDRLEANGHLNSGDALRVLTELLESVEIPQQLAGRQLSLKKRLAGLAPGDDLQSVVGDFAALLTEVHAHSGSEDKPATLKGRRHKRLFGRWFPRPPVGDSGMAREMLTGLLGSLSLPDRWQAHLDALEPRVRSAESRKQLLGLARDLAALWNESAAGPATRTSLFTLNEALLQLLERLQLPAELRPQIEDLQHRLEAEVGEHEWPDLLEDVAELIATLRSKARRETREIEEFFAQLSTRLQELDDFLQGMEAARVDSLDSGRKLDVAVQEHVRDLHTGMRDVADMGQLKNLIQNRLEAISEHMQRFREAEETRNEAAEARIRQLSERLHNLETEAGELRTRINQERQLALIDGLTGVGNRMAYEERVVQEHARWKRFGEPLSLLVVDIDRFKQINDNYGHKAGDKVLKTISNLLHSSIRETDFLARYGGEEFVILVPGADAKAALGIADKLRKQVETCGFHYRGSNVPITISCGVAGFGDADTPDDVFERADAAMYRAKQAGRNRSMADGL
jgi:diguanylate cyclase